MKADVRRHYRSCLVCASRKGTRTFKPPLQPIPVGGLFHRVAVDILKLPLMANGNRYVAIFMDYLTKWPEAFAIPDQKAETMPRCSSSILSVDMAFQKSCSPIEAQTSFPI